MQIARRTLHDSPLLRVGQVDMRPDTAAEAAPGALEQQPANLLVLPLAGVFARHDAPRRHVVGTPNHALFIAAGSPYRLSFPGGIGDRSLTLWFGAEALACALPQALARDGFDLSAHAAHALLPPAAMLSRSLLWRRLARGEADALEAEERGLGLLACALQAARRNPRRSSQDVPRLRGTARTRRIERVKEAVALQPERRWTLGELAALACVSPFHLARLFRAEVGVPVYRYALRARLARALDAVLDADTELSAIAFEAGFASHSHLTARFRALFGVAPAELRRTASAAGVARLRAELRKNVTAREPLAA